MIGLAIDFETNGFSPKQHQVTEIGAVVFNENFEVLESMNVLCYKEDYPPQSKEIIDVTGITDEDLKTEGIHPKAAFEQLVAMILKYDVDFFLAHNAPFDKGFFDVYMALLEAKFDKPWVCSMRDIDHPQKFKCKKLSHLALDYGVMVDPSTLHRASGDIKVMLAMVKASGVDIRELLSDSQTPRIIVRAVVPNPFAKDGTGDGGKGKDKAKECGFGWQKAPGTDGPEIKNCWLKQIKETDYEKEQEKIGEYKLVRIEAI